MGLSTLTPACCAFLVIIITLLSQSFLAQQSHGQNLNNILETQSSTLHRLFKDKYFLNSNQNQNLNLNQNLNQGENINYEDEDGDKDKDKDEDGKSSSTKEKDRIERLPGQPTPVDFAQYGGYVTIDSKAGSALFYYFVEAEHNPHSAPLVLWLNGGPGCSSLAYGAMQELGPFRVNSDGKTLYRNNYAWNKQANVLFLESPVGVGFSYSNRSLDYKTNGDNKTAIDNRIFLLNWMERFPEYKGRDFYIAGESYAGHYVPQLASVILHHNNNHNKPIINLKGILIGNAVINDETDLKGMIDYYWTHAMISDQVRSTIMNHCDFSPAASSQPQVCQDAFTEASESLGDIDIYNIYAPNCLSTLLTTKPKKPTDVIDPCSEYYVFAYMNSPEVQKALHANVTKLTHQWQPCSQIIKWTDSATTIIPQLTYFMANSLRVWIFSGDTDGRVPVTSTKYSLNTMKLSVSTKWYPWYTTEKEVGGYAEAYEGNITLVTVRGAGHQVPSYKPASALAMVNHFITGSPLPTTKN